MPIPEPLATLAELLSQDGRYKFEAYVFLQRSLAYAQKVLKMGGEGPSLEERLAAAAEEDGADNLGAELEQEIEEALAGRERPVRHLTGQELCEAIRQFAIHEYGLLARIVLNSWGVHTTGDFGEIVYNMIRAGLMRKSRTDRREDFDDQYDFAEVFERRFRILPEPAAAAR
jgi:uncharacterized repeat protein (TIGR04138 family)